jgi:phage gp46-like protein
MPGDRVLSPLTLDYVPDGRGAWQTTPTIATAIHHQLRSERNGWCLDPDAGSDLHTLARLRLTEGVALRAGDTIRAALKPLVEEGRAADVAIRAERQPGGLLALEGTVRDVQHGPIDLEPLLPFGA